MSLLGWKYVKAKISPATAHNKAIPKNILTDFPAFQNKTKDTNVKIWLAGENILKKSPGFTVLKNARAAMTELGISLSVATALTNEL